MSNSSEITGRPGLEIPPDDLRRGLKLVRADTDRDLPHIGLAGDTYTILLAGDDTNGRFCLIDMFVPPGGGPPPHRHDFEETFTILEGEVNATFRGRELIVRAGETIHIPSNAPHQFHNSSSAPARMLCICSPAGQENFFKQIGTLVEGRTSPPPQPDEPALRRMEAKVKELAPKYRTELLQNA